MYSRTTASALSELTDLLLVRCARRPHADVGRFVDGLLVGERLSLVEEDRWDKRPS
jgi:hypothetical protein